MQAQTATERLRHTKDVHRAHEQKTAMQMAFSVVRKHNEHLVARLLHLMHMRTLKAKGLARDLQWKQQTDKLYIDVTDAAQELLAMKDDHDKADEHAKWAHRAVFMEQLRANVQCHRLSAISIWQRNMLLSRLQHHDISQVSARSTMQGELRSAQYAAAVRVLALLLSEWETMKMQTKRIRALVAIWATNLRGDKFMMATAQAGLKLQAMSTLSKEMAETVDTWKQECESLRTQLAESHAANEASLAQTMELQEQLDAACSEGNTSVEAAKAEGTEALAACQQEMDVVRCELAQVPSNIYHRKRRNMPYTAVHRLVNIEQK